MPRFTRIALICCALTTLPATARPDVDTYSISLKSDPITGISRTIDIVPATRSVDSFDLAEGAVGTTYTFADLNDQAVAVQAGQPTVQGPSATPNHVTLDLHQNGTYNLYVSSSSTARSDGTGTSSSMPGPISLFLIGGSTLALAGTARWRRFKRKSAPFP